MRVEPTRQACGLTQVVPPAACLLGPCPACLRALAGSGRVGLDRLKAAAFSPFRLPLVVWMGKIANAGTVCQAGLAGLGVLGCLVCSLDSRDLTEFPGLSWLAVQGEVRHDTEEAWHCVPVSALAVVVGRGQYDDRRRWLGDL